MSESIQIPVTSEIVACQAIAAAVAQGVRAAPEVAAASVIEYLEAAFGPVVQEIIALIESGANDLSAILQALATAEVTLPPWVNVVITILLALAKKN